MRERVLGGWDDLMGVSGEWQLGGKGSGKKARGYLSVD